MKLPAITTIWLTAIIAAAVILIVGFSGSFQECVASIPHGGYYKDHPKDITFFLLFPFRFLGCSGSFVHENADAIIAAFTVILAWSTIKLWSETKLLREGADGQSEKMERSIGAASRAADAMRDVATASAANVEALKTRSALQMRAYLTVLVNNGIYQERDKKGALIKRFEGQPLLVNNGQTPARKVSYWANAGILPVPLPASYKLPDADAKTSHSAVLGPHQNFSLNAMVKEVVDDSEVFPIMAGTGRAVYVWGQVTYEDVFGEPHFTDFCGFAQI
jgi:hypothetical protein